MINCYVISLASENARRDHIITEFSKSNVDFSFFDAINPLNAAKYIDKLGLKEKSFGNLSAGEVACALSHIKLWHIAVEKKLKYIAIFEDDIHLGEHFNYLMADTEWLQDIDIVKLENFRKRVELSFTSKKIKKIDRSIYKILGKNLGTGGYILSLEGAKYLIQYIENLKEIEVIDALMFNQRRYVKTLPVYQLKPAVVVQDSILNGEDVILLSSIDQSRQQGNEVNNQQKISFPVKIKREFIRLTRSFRLKNIGFR